MVLLSPSELSQRINGAVSGVTLRKWAKAGRIRNARRLPNGRLVFTEDAIGEILAPVSDDAGDAGGFVDVSIPGFGVGVADAHVS